MVAVTKLAAILLPSPPSLLLVKLLAAARLLPLTKLVTVTKLLPPTKLVTATKKLVVALDCNSWYFRAILGYICKLVRTRSVQEARQVEEEGTRNVQGWEEAWKVQGWEEARNVQGREEWREEWREEGTRNVQARNVQGREEKPPLQGQEQKTRL